MKQKLQTKPALPVPRKTINSPDEIEENEAIAAKRAWVEEAKANLCLVGWHRFVAEDALNSGRAYVIRKINPDGETMQVFPSSTIHLQKRSFFQKVGRRKHRIPKRDLIIVEGPAVNENLQEWFTKSFLQKLQGRTQ